MLWVKVGSDIEDVNTMQLAKEFSVSSGVMKKTIEKDIATGCARVLSGHDEVGGRDITMELSGTRKGVVALAAGESEFVGAFSKEGLSSIDGHRRFSQLTSGRSARTRARTPRNSLLLMLTVRIWPTRRLRPRRRRRRRKKVYFNVEKITVNHVSKWALTCVVFSKEAGVLADNMDASLPHAQQIKKTTISR